MNRRSIVGSVVAATMVIASALSAEAAEKPYRIGFMVWDTAQPFYSNMMKAARETAKLEGVNLDIQGGKADLATEIAVVQQFIAQHVDLILLTASDPKGIVPAVRMANAAKIPVIAVNTRVDIESGAKVVTYVGVDDYAFGQIQGKLLAQSVNGKGRVAYIMGKLGMSPQLKRKAGLEDTLKNYPDIKIVETQVANWDSAQALAVTQDFLSKHPKGSLDVILDQGPEAVNGAIFAAQQGRSDVKFIMGDYPANVRNAILKGTVYGTVNQDPSPQGSHAVKDAILWLDGNQKAVPQPEHLLDLPIVTKENADQFPAAWGE